MMSWISPHFQYENFPSPMSLDQKIDVFEDRVKGWQLDIAQQCADHIHHSGFAVLDIVCSYFEMIAKFQDGFAASGKSKKYFKKGVYSVFPSLRNNPSQALDKLLIKLYEDVRCGLYHSGITGRGIALSGDFKYSIEFTSPPDTVNINPHRLVPDLSQHFQSYIDQLRNPKNQDLRKNFESRFDYQHK